MLARASLLMWGASMIKITEDFSQFCKIDRSKLIMSFRKIKAVSPANMVNMGGFHVRQPLPTSTIDNIDPFLLLHHAEVNYKDSKGSLESGVGPHPHRGFSPVSFVFEGGVHHRDSLGNNSIIRDGGVQWINSGSGIMHSERPPQDLVGKDLQQEFIQLWVNTPAAHKMDAPSYQGYAKEEIPTLESKDGLVEVKVVAGEVGGVKGPVSTKTDVMAAMVFLKENGSQTIKLDHSHDAMIYLLNGKVKINGIDIAGKNLVIFNTEGDGFSIEAIETSKALLLSGAPIKEPICSYGPFVMNKQSEIIDALNDAQSGKMGVLHETI